MDRQGPGGQMDEDRRLRGGWTRDGVGRQRGRGGGVGFLLPGRRAAAPRSLVGLERCRGLRGALASPCTGSEVSLEPSPRAEPLGPDL